MGSHPINLILRFLLELFALLSIGLWAWKQSDSWLRFMLAFGIPTLLAIVWAVFAVPDDPSRSGSAPIPTNGIIRLVIELVIFGFALWALYDLNWHKTSLAIGLIIVLHYSLSYDRIVWLLAQKQSNKP